MSYTWRVSRETDQKKKIKKIVSLLISEIEHERWRFNNRRTERPEI